MIICHTILLYNIINESLVNSKVWLLCKRLEKRVCQKVGDGEDSFPMFIWLSFFIYFHFTLENVGEDF